MSQNCCEMYVNAIFGEYTGNFTFLLRSGCLCLDFGMTARTPISSIVVNVCDAMPRVLKRSLLLRKASKT